METTKVAKSATWKIADEETSLLKKMKLEKEVLQAEIVN